jgi:hypothetical protein
MSNGTTISRTITLSCTSDKKFDKSVLSVLGKKKIIPAAV